MVITDEAIQVDRKASNTSPPRRYLRRLGIGAAIVVAPVALVAFVGSANPTTSDQQHELAPRTRDDIVRDLVARGVVPAATLDDGTQITGPGFEPAPRTRDDVVRDLVARGVVPAATLDDGTQITGPGFEPTPRTRDEIVRDLVARGVVPAATLDDGSQITSSTEP